MAGFFVGNITAKRGEGASPTDVAAADGHGDATAGQEDLFRVPVGNSPAKGSREALVTIVEFSDFQ